MGVISSNLVFRSPVWKGLDLSPLACRFLLLVFSKASHFCSQLWPVFLSLGTLVQPLQKIFCCVEKRQLPDALVEVKESENLTALLKDSLPPFF